MAAVISATPDELTVSDLLERFGPIPISRIRMHPQPGTATENDVVEIADHEDRLCELVDGILLEKDMGFLEAWIAGRLVGLFHQYLDRFPLGIAVGDAGLMRLAPGLVRIPDVSFISWERMPGRRVPTDAIAPFGPDLAVEVLSKGNTKKEMADKLVDYFEAGARLVWYIDPKKATVTVYDSVDRATVLTGEDVLTGGDVLPGFAVPVKELFAVPQAPTASEGGAAV